MAPEDVVEVPVRIEHDGPVPLPQSPVAPELLGLMQHVAAYERLAARAATSGDPTLVKKALLTHPLIAQSAVADDLVERLLEAGAEHLPRFRTTPAEAA
jgi:6-phospho-beta-glucosidase